MNEKNKSILGLIIFFVAFLYMIYSGLGEKYYVVVWLLGACTGLAFAKINK